MTPTADYAGTRITRIPLTIITPGGVTDDVLLVGVLASDLDVLERAANEVEDEVRRLQAMLDQAVDGDLSCEDICRVVCAGPCEGRPFGPVMKPPPNDGTEADA